jgi:hypothetical protein
MKFTSMVGSDESDMTALGNDSRHNHLRSVSAVVKGKYYFAPLRTSSIAEIFVSLWHYQPLIDLCQGFGIRRTLHCCYMV